jgi:hypothetical protein
VLLSVLLAVLLPAPEAHACSAPFTPCTEALVRPRAGALVPANVPALRFVPSRGQFGSEPLDGGQPVTLHGPDGGVVPLDMVPEESGGVLLQPLSPLEERAQYTLRYAEPCTANVGLDAGVRQVAHRFGTSARTPLPQQAGHLTLLAREEGTVGESLGTDSCGSPHPSGRQLPAVWVRLGVFLSPELAAYEELAAVQLRLGPGGADIPVRAPTAPERQAHPGLFRVGLVHTACAGDGGMTMASGHLPPGAYTAVLSAALPGAPAPPAPASLPFTLACDAGRADGGTQPGEGGAGGCSSATAGALLPAAALALLAARRRRLPR